MTIDPQKMEEEMVSEFQELTLSRDPQTALTARIGLELAPTIVRIVKNEALRDTPRVLVLASVVAVQTDLLYTLIRGIIPGKGNQDEVLKEIGAMIQTRIDSKSAQIDEALTEKSYV